MLEYMIDIHGFPIVTHQLEVSLQRHVIPSCAYVSRSDLTYNFSLFLNGIIIVTIVANMLS